MMAGKSLDLAGTDVFDPIVDEQAFAAGQSEPAQCQAVDFGFGFEQLFRP